MKPIELKFLLKLLGKADYRAAIADLKPNEKTSVTERDKICIDLTDRGIVAYSRKIEKFKLEPSAKALLELDVAESPLTVEQLAVLRACQKKAATPGELKSILPTDRQRIIQDVERKGFIKADKVRIQEVWLTDRGREYLREECNITSSSLISLNLLQNYVIFLRKELHAASRIAPTQPSSFASKSSVVTEPVNESSEAIDSADKPTDIEILQLIKQLDRELGTGNYLPIFYLRQKLQPPLTREELDQALYRLQRKDQIELNSLVEAIRYTPEQIQAGIPQDTGGSLFFVVVNDSP